MNEDIMRQAGLGKQVDMVKKGICPTCGKKDAKSTLRTEEYASVAEFNISGMCQQCQDEVFSGEEPEC